MSELATAEHADAIAPDEPFDKADISTFRADDAEAGTNICKLLVAFFFYSLLAMAFVYAVEDRFLDRLLAQEARRQHAHFERHGTWTPPAGEAITLHTRTDSLPAELRSLLAEQPHRREASGEAGRHYHLRPLQPAMPPAQ